jgi:hypothetical protein
VGIRKNLFGCQRDEAMTRKRIYRQNPCIAERNDYVAILNLACTNRIIYEKDGIRYLLKKRGTAIEVKRLKAGEGSEGLPTEETERALIPERGVRKKF